MGVDMALGKERGDYSALSVVAKHKENGTIYVIDSFGDRIKVDEFIEVIVEKVLEWQPDVIAVESVAAQEFFADRSEEHTSELQSRGHLVCRLLLEKK